MKQFFQLLIFLLPLSAFGQNLLVYEDSTNHFTIGVPMDWKYGIPKDKSTTFKAGRKAKDSIDIVRESFSVNVLYGKPSDLNVSYKEFMGAIEKAPSFKILEQGEKDINGRHYKWLMETHHHPGTNEQVANYVYFANSGKSLLILTMVSSTTAFKKYRELYDRVANSLVY
ncbi:MAG: hypothetical protein ABIO46_07875 [Chitinophagales bacterium]